MIHGQQGSSRKQLCNNLSVHAICKTETHYPNFILPLLLGLASSVAQADPLANTGDVSVGVVGSFGSPPSVLKIIDNTTRKPVKNTPVRIYSDTWNEYKSSPALSMRLEMLFDDTR